MQVISAPAASDEGVHWKVHDPSASGATEWALSLLGDSLLYAALPADSGGFGVEVGAVSRP